ncbi:probable methyltransferase TCM_000336 [Lolium rigidum]|uniref:probable methyltransferase TCM_000336 n=1 Tax=Lolium rigidum TaxID=89674 RepID=UPI001F5D116F|nr:probable methyltransferase TCM_000336 [Lolium rigidum]
MASSLLHCSDKLPFMNVETILHMKEGLDENSYAQNSSLQKRGMDTLKSLIVNSATDVYISQMPERFTVADLGCSSGPNALCLVEDIVGSIGKISCRSSQPPPEFSVLLNDLPTNDFNTIFFSLPEFTDRLKSAAKSDEWGRPMVFLSGVPGSFYGRLFPRTSVHFICSCSSLHWLSQVPHGLFDETNMPINKGKMYISSTSPDAVSVAYRRQFQRDFSLFLKSRAAEVFPGGRMVLAMLGRQTGECVDKRTTFLWELLSESFAALVSQGLVEQDKVDAYNVPFYAPSLEEIEVEVRLEGSFSLDYVQTYEINLSSSGDAKEDGRTVSMAIRAIQESMLSHHFGPHIVDALFHKYTELVTESMEREEVKSVQIGVVLSRL